MYQRLKQKGIHHVCVRVPNLYETADFYRNTFDATPVVEWGDDEHENHAILLDLGTGDYLEIFGSSKPFGLGKWQHIAIWTDNMEAVYERALANGAKIHTNPAISHHQTPSGEVVHMKFGFLIAPGGEMVELIEDVDADAQL